MDPELAEAYWWLGRLAHQPYRVAYLKAHAAQARVYLDHADKLEPALHPFTTLDRADLYFGAAPTRANATAGLSLLREFLRLWPENPHADTYRSIVAQVEKSLAGKDLR